MTRRLNIGRYIATLVITVMHVYSTMVPGKLIRVLSAEHTNDNEYYNGTTKHWGTMTQPQADDHYTA